jgi:arylsulfatase A-like enzyme
MDSQWKKLRACGQERPRNVILITFDSLSAADMSLHGYGRATTPCFDVFAKECVVSNSAFASSNSSFPSLWSIISGRYPAPGIWPRRLFQFVSGLYGRDTIIGCLLGRGYRVRALVSLQDGFFDYDSTNALPFPRFRPRVLGSSRWGSYFGWKRLSSVEAVFAKAYRFLLDARPPYFLWLHVYKPHEPYVPRKEFLHTFLKDRIFESPWSQRPYLYRPYREEIQTLIDMLRSRYDEQILETDFILGKFMSLKAVQEALQDAVLVMTSDHGEMFEKGYQGHDGPLLYRSVVHVPLLFRIPYMLGGQKIASPVGHVDIAPTILHCLGVPVPSSMEGVPLLRSVVEPNGIESRLIFSLSDTFSQGGANKSLGCLSVTDGFYRFIQKGNEGLGELYDIRNDPEESEDIREDFRMQAKRLQHVIQQRFAEYGAIA